MSNLQQSKNDIYSTNYLYAERQKAEHTRRELEKLYHLSKSETEIFKTIRPTYSERPNGKVIALVGDIPSIPHFAQPIYDNGVSYIDARPYTTKLGEIKNQMDYDFLIRRAILNSIWIESPATFLSPELINLLARVFSDWISSALMRNLNFDDKTITNCKIILMSYIIAQSVGSTYLTESEIEAFVIKKARDVLKLPHEFVLSLFEIYPSVFYQIFSHPGRLSFLCTGLSKIYGEDEYISERILYQLTSSGATMMANSTQLTCIGLEHLPTFVALVHSVNLPSMKTTKIGAALFNCRTQFGDILEKFMKLHTGYETLDVR
jgi:hypothetical protein